MVIRWRAAGEDREPWRAYLPLLLITLAGAMLRSYHLGLVRLRNDEGFSLLYARQSWPAVLGFDGFYDFHPPGSFALAKAADLVVPELLASRSVSLTAAVATLPVMYALACRLLDRNAAVIATLLLALSPAHIEYARIGRMYATTTFLVLLSYLMLVKYREDGRARAVLYGACLAAAMYVDYSALYALAPQVVVLAMVMRARWPESKALLWSMIGAVLAYGPWLTQLPGTVRLANEYSRRLSYLAASWERIRAATYELTGLTSDQATSGRWESPWSRWTDLRLALLLALIGVTALGVWNLRQRPLAMAISLSLLLGTPLAAIVSSLVSPGFDLRTIIPAVPGWCLVLAAACRPFAQPRMVGAVGMAGVALLLVISIWSLPAQYDRSDLLLRYDDIAQTLAATRDPQHPILTFSTGGMDTDVIDAYAGDELEGVPIISFVDGELEPASAMSRWLTVGPSRLDVRDQGLAPFFDPTTPGHEAFWFVTHRSPTVFQRAFQAAGYERLAHLDYGRAWLDLWALPGADVGSQMVDVGGLTWKGGAGEGDSIGSIAAQAGLYVVTDPEGAVTFLQCRSGSGRTLATMSAGDNAGTGKTSLAGDRLAVFCPAGTAAVEITRSGGDASELTMTVEPARDP